MMKMDPDELTRIYEEDRSFADAVSWLELRELPVPGSFVAAPGCTDPLVAQPDPPEHGERFRRRYGRRSGEEMVPGALLREDWGWSVVISVTVRDVGSPVPSSHQEWQIVHMRLSEAGERVLDVLRA